MTNGIHQITTWVCVITNNDSVPSVRVMAEAKIQQIYEERLVLLPGGDSISSGQKWIQEALKHQGNWPGRYHIHVLSFVMAEQIVHTIST